MNNEDGNNESKVRADRNAIAIGGINIGGDISGTIQIGHTTGYTADQVSVLITQIQSSFHPKPFDGRSPYKGLDVFEEEDAELFFGREKLVGDLVSRVKDSRTVFVTGPSGSGKSSLVRAGLIHALKQGAIKNSERWLYATMKPGRDPIGELGRVAASLAGSTNAEDEIRAKTIADATIFARWCEIALKEGRDKRVVLFIDQFEEVFTQINTEAERVAFLNLLTHAATVKNGRVIILFSMRSDFVSNCATYPQLNALLNRQFVQIGAMQPEELVSAIAQPALRVGLHIDPDLIAQIINEMKGEPGALPLMQFALKDLFDSQQEKNGVIALSLNDYLQRGGIHKALERHADDSFAKLNRKEQELARSIFSGLIEIGRGTQDTKRTAVFDELVPANTKAEEIEAIVQKLADARLITTDEAAGKDTVTISHEKLIDAWPWLKKLVNENRDGIALQNEIASDAKEWDEHEKDTSYVYTGGRLANVREQLEKQKIGLSHLAQEFIRAGLAKQRRTQVWLVSAVSVILIAAILASVVFQNQARANIEIANTAQAASTFAIAQQVTAQANAEEALARQLASQAQPLFQNGNSKQMIAALLSIQSMRLFPTEDAAQILQNNTLARPIAQITQQDGMVNSVVFSSDGKYIASGGCDSQLTFFYNGCAQGSAHVWEAITGKEITSHRHDGNVTSLAFGPDGNYVISGSSDGTAQVWDAKTGIEIARMTHEGWVLSVAFSPDGKYVVSGGEDGTARVWEAVTGKEIARMTHNGSVFAVSFSPDGESVISGSGDGSARVWEARTGKEISRMKHDDVVTAVAFSPDGKYVVSGSDDFTARVWEPSTGREISHMTHDSNSVTSAAFSPDSKYVVSGGLDNTARVWEANTGREISRMNHDDWVSSVAFSPDGKYVVTGSKDNTARIWEAATGEEVARMTHNAPVNSVNFSSDGKYVASGSNDSTARVWEANTVKDVTRLTHEGIVRSIAFSPDGRYLVTGSEDYTARVWETSTGKEIARMTHDGVVTSVAFSPDGKYIVSSGESSVLVWEAASGNEIARMTHDGGISSVAFSPDGKYVASGGFDNTIRIWDAFIGKEIARMDQNNWVSTIAFSPDGKYVVSGSIDSRRGNLNNNSEAWAFTAIKEIAVVAAENSWMSAFGSNLLNPMIGNSKLESKILENPSIRVWETSTGKEISRMINADNTSQDVYAVAFSPDGKYVVSGSSDQTARVWEADTGKEVARMAHAGSVSSVDFSPNGKYVVSGSDDGTARVWETGTGREIARMTHESHVKSVAFSPDGRYVLSGSEDDTARVWDADTGKEVARMTHKGFVSFVIFSPDDKYVVSSDDATSLVWKWRSEDLISEACAHITRNLTRTEWNQYIDDALPYQAVCPDLPIEPKVTPTPAITSTP